MEFTGQIIKVLPKRSGTSERTGNAWETQGFIFEYKEHDTDPWHDRVYLETFDTNIMANLVEGAVAKVGFRHKTDEYNGRTYNRVQMNSFELIGKPMEATAQPANQPTQDANGQQGVQQSAQGNQDAQQATFPPKVDANVNRINKEGGFYDLPF